MLGFALSVKLHAAGLALPFAVALLAWPARPGGWEPVRMWSRAHRRALSIGGGAFFALALALNAVGPTPDAADTAKLLAAVAAFAVLGLVLRLARPLRRWADLALALTGAGLAGAIVPNLLFAALPPTALGWVADSLVGGGVNEGARPSLSLLETLRPWLPFIGVAVIGVVVALRRGDRTAILWPLAAAAMGALAYARYGQLHYYAPAIALLVLPAVEALRPLSRRPLLLVIALAAVLYGPYSTGIHHAQERGDEAARAEQVNDWLLTHLREGEVALTKLESSDSRHFYLVRRFAPGGAEPQYRLLPFEQPAADYVRANDLRVAYFASFGPEDVAASLAAIGLQGGAVRVVGAPAFVYRITQ